jgi:hypothetical protein
MIGKSGLLGIGSPDGPLQSQHEYVRDGNLPKWHGFHAFRRGLAMISGVRTPFSHRAISPSENL